MSSTVSIIVPVYNCEDYIEEAVQSVLDQTCPDWELILVNDGSADHSGEICRKYASRDSRITYMEQENKGVSAARNAGIGKAVGKHILFLDGDDKLYPNAVETLLNSADDVDLVVFGIQQSGGRVICSVDEEKCYENVADSARDIGRIYVNSFYKSPCNKFYLRERVTSLFDESCAHGEDLLFNLGYYENCGRIRAIPQLLYYYRESMAGSLTKQFHADTDEYLSRLLNRMLEVVGDTPGVRNTVSRDVMQVLLVQTKRLMNSDRSAGEKRAIIKKWSKNPVIRDKRINKKAGKNIRHRIIFTLYQLRLVTPIMMICR